MMQWYFFVICALQRLYFNAHIGKLYLVYEMIERCTFLSSKVRSNLHGGLVMLSIYDTCCETLI